MTACEQIRSKYNNTIRDISPLLSVLSCHANNWVNVASRLRSRVREAGFREAEQYLVNAQICTTLEVIETRMQWDEHLDVGREAGARLCRKR